jgi:hypothetical protein
MSVQAALMGLRVRRGVDMRLCVFAVPVNALARALLRPAVGQVERAA